MTLQDGLSPQERDALFLRLQTLLFQPGCSAWALVDPMQGVPPRFAAQVEMARRVGFGPRLDLAQTLRPALLVLDERGDVLSATLDCALAQLSPEKECAGQGSFVGGWLVSPASDREVAAYLGQCVIQPNLRAQQRYVRLPDSRVMRALWRTCAPKDRERMLGPVLQWITFLPGPDAVVLEVRSHGPGDAPQTACKPWRANAEQWAQIDRLVCVNIALAQWRVETAQAAGLEHARRFVADNADPDAKPATLADRAVAAAMALGWRERTDLVAFAAQALRRGEGFHLHPPHRQALTQALADKRPAADAILDAELGIGTSTN